MEWARHADLLRSHEVVTHATVEGLHVAPIPFTQSFQSGACNLVLPVILPPHCQGVFKSLGCDIQRLSEQSPVSDMQLEALFTHSQRLPSGSARRVSLVHIQVLQHPGQRINGNGIQSQSQNYRDRINLSARKLYVCIPEAVHPRATH